MGRHKDPTSAAGKMRGYVLELIEQHRAAGTIPTNCRFLYYELVARGLASKEHTRVIDGVEKPCRPDRPVNDALTTLRKQGLVKWEEISDETRDISDYQGKPTIKDALYAKLDACRLDFWDGVAPLVITESRSLRGALNSVASRYNIPITSLNGQCAGHLYNEVAPILRTE